jgi:cathepsin B
MSDKVRENSPSPAPKKRVGRSETPEQKEEKDKINAMVEKAKAGIKKKAKKPGFEKYGYHIVFGIFGLILVGTLLSMFFSKSKKLHLTPVIEEDEIESHNENDYGYTLAANSFFQDWKLADAKFLMNNQPALRQQLARCMSGADNTILEDKFDFREAHPLCLGALINQTNCSSSYALAAASAFSDRYCMATGKNVRASAQTFLSCNDDEEDREQCAGGNVVEVVEFAKKHGFVDEQCLPYMGEATTPCLESVKSCPKYFTQEFCIASTPEGIKREILKNGPVIAVMPVYRDFLVYKAGVYQVLEGTSKFQGGHAVKIIGWGTDKDINEDYWIIENTWGSDWGVNGFAHVAIGQKQLYLDEFTIAISPKYEVEEGDETDETEPVAKKGGKGKKKAVDEDAMEI